MINKYYKKIDEETDYFIREFRRALPPQRTDRVRT